MKIWVVSDLHYFHANIIKYSGRPYQDIDEMHDDLVEKWNSVVQDNDIVYFLGDFRMGRHVESIDKKLVNELAGRKKMILGNHDKHFNVYLPDGKKNYSVNTNNEAIFYWQKMGFEEVFAQPIILDNYYILSHEPINGVNHSQIFANIHGHTHDVNMTNGNYFNVSVENINYTPIEFEKIKESFSLEN